MPGIVLSADNRKLVKLIQTVEGMIMAIERIERQLDALEARIDALESRRGPGRPPREVA